MKKFWCWLTHHKHWVYTRQELTHKRGAVCWKCNTWHTFEGRPH